MSVSGLTVSVLAVCALTEGSSISGPKQSIGRDHLRGL